jgi:transglutaminase-like putative cysteine protease
MKRNAILGLVLCSFWTLTWAAAGEALDLQFRYGHYYTTFVIQQDGTATESRDWAMTVLKETAVEWSKRTSITYSTSAQRAEVIAAYTQKADGRRIDVPKDNYQVEINQGKEKDSPVYSDNTTLTVVFPEVTVGDTVVFSYRLVQTEPLFPKHFSVAESFSRDTAFDDVRVHMDYPASMWVQYLARDLTEKEIGEKDGRKIIVWTYANPRPVKSTRRDYSVYDPEKETGYAFSTFKNYGEISTAYGVRALPKAAVTERIQKLAAEIVKDKTALREQARALYDWVATHITYAGNCIGIGAVVPRDLAFILDNRMGDCKDHATLLQALLNARGISSTQALVNAGATYRLAKIPVVSSVNHVITYFPVWDIYADSTSDSTPFGMLPFQDEGKPVLWVEGFKDGSKTPVSSVGSNQQSMRSVLKMAPDGSVSGTVEVSQKGRGAAETRAWTRKLTKEVEEDLVKNVFRAQGMIGQGKFEKSDPIALIDTNHYKLQFSAEKFIKLPGTGAFDIHPIFNAGGSIQSLLADSLEPEKQADVVCSGGTATEEYVMVLPKTLKVLAIPDDLALKNQVVSYRASYRLKGNTLTVKRSLDDRTPGNICSPQTMLEYKKFADKVMDNLKSQVLYKQ